MLVRQGAIVLLLTAGIAEDHPARDYVLAHGSGPATIALATADPVAALADALGKGAVVLPGTAAQTRFRAFGDVGHTFVTPGSLLTAVAPSEQTEPAPLDLLDAVDHVAVCVPIGELTSTIEFYQEVLGFSRIFEEHIEVGAQAMNSQVVQSPSGEVTLTVLEPDPAGQPGQIDGFIAAHDGAGVQHIALRSTDIAKAVRTLGERGVTFLTTPGSYYEELERRLGHIGLPVETLRELNILVDRDEVGELFQIFARSTHPRGTFFMELIERRHALTFGTANIKALYEAVEREQSRANVATS